MIDVMAVLVAGVIGLAVYAALVMGIIGLAFKFVTKKAWLVSFKYGLYVLGATLLSSFALKLIGVNLTGIASVLFGYAVFYAIGTWKFGLDWKKALYTYGIYLLLVLVVAGLVLLGLLSKYGLTAMSLM